VAAASYEAQRFGVRSAMPSTIVMRKCADLVFVPPRFDVYRAVSQEIRAIFTEYTPWLSRCRTLIEDGLRWAPHAVYTPVQTALVQDEALKLANARISPPIFKEDEPKAD
jgi:impB/mucB/samB family